VGLFDAARRAAQIYHLLCARLTMAKFEILANLWKNVKFFGKFLGCFGACTFAGHWRGGRACDGSFDAAPPGEQLYQKLYLEFLCKFSRFVRFKKEKFFSKISIRAGIQTPNGMAARGV